MNAHQHQHQHPCPAPAAAAEPHPPRSCASRGVPATAGSPRSFLPLITDQLLSKLLGVNSPDEWKDHAAIPPRSPGETERVYKHICAEIYPCTAQRPSPHTQHSPCSLHGETSARGAGHIRGGNVHQNLYRIWRSFQRKDTEL